MHRVDRHEERLDARVIGDGAAASRVGLHPVHEDLERALQRVQELLLLIHFAILELLRKELTQF